MQPRAGEVFPDLRRRGSFTRERVAPITEHVRWLPKTERALVQWVFRSERPLSELAAMGEAPTWVLSRRLRRIAARAASREFRYVAGLLGLHESPPSWPPEARRGRELDEEALQLAVARGLFINGLTVREVARELGMPRPRVARIRDVFALRAEALAK